MNRDELIKQLKGIRSIATMKQASFESMHKPTILVIEGDQIIARTNSALGSRAPNAEFHDPLTAFIARQTDLWRRSWIIGPLDEIIHDLESGPCPTCGTPRTKG